MSNVTVQPWPNDEAPTATTIRQMMTEEGVPPYSWSNGPGDVYAAHTHSYQKVIYVVQGAITFDLPKERRKVSLQAGDRLDLPAGVRHDAVVGPQGVVCLEGHR